MNVPHWLAMRLQEIADFVDAEMPLPKCSNPTSPCNWSEVNVCINCDRARGIEWAIAFLRNRLRFGNGVIPAKTPVSWGESLLQAIDAKEIEP